MYIERNKNITNRKTASKTEEDWRTRASDLVIYNDQRIQDKWGWRSEYFRTQTKQQDSNMIRYLDTISTSARSCKTPYVIREAPSYYSPHGHAWPSASPDLSDQYWQNFDETSLPQNLYKGWERLLTSTESSCNMSHSCIFLMHGKVLVGCCNVIRVSEDGEYPAFEDDPTLSRHLSNKYRKWASKAINS